MNRHERQKMIKRLQRRLALLAVRREHSQAAYEQSHDRLCKLDAMRDSTQRQLALLGDASDTLVVSDHARVRYMERVHGIDVNQIDAEILGGRSIPRLVNGRYTIGEHFICVRDNIVVTVVCRREPRQKRPKPWRESEDLAG